MLELQKIAELVAYRESASLGIITSFLEEYIEKLKHVKYDEHFPESILWANWAIMHTQDGIYDVIKGLVRKAEEEKKATFWVITVPSYPNKPKEGWLSRNSKSLYIYNLQRSRPQFS
jgi:hypothetical protein